MIIRSFGKLSDGREAGLYILSNKNGMEAHITDYGAAIVRLIVPGRYGIFYDVVLGYDDAAGYEKGSSSFGGTVGRFANRISKASFDMNGRHYILTANDGPNTLHGGRDFYVHRIWSPVISFGKISTRDLASSRALESMNDWSREPRGRDKSTINTVSADVDPAAEQSAPAGDSITFRLISPDGDQGFPGELLIEVTYTLTEDNELHIDYRASMTNGPEAAKVIPGTVRESGAGREKISTPLNLTNHSYFNLGGHSNGTVLTHTVQINADKFTETDNRSIPTGTLLDVKWTPMDFRKPKTIGSEIDSDYEPLRFGNGYDHNYVLRTGPDPDNSSGEGFTGGYREVASMSAADSGIMMTVLTDLPGMQFYTANYLDGEPGKDGAVYRRRSAACFETQFWPDAVNKENFPGGELREGEEFTSRTTYRFSVLAEE